MENQGDWWFPPVYHLSHTKNMKDISENERVVKHRFWIYTVAFKFLTWSLELDDILLSDEIWLNFIEFNFNVVS